MAQENYVSNEDLNSLLGEYTYPHGYLDYVSTLPFLGRLRCSTQQSDEVLFPYDRHGQQVRSFEWNENMKGKELQPGAWPVDRLYAAYIHAPEKHLLIPHIGGRRAILDWHHPKLERLIEIGSAWGHFP